KNSERRARKRPGRSCIWEILEQRLGNLSLRLLVSGKAFKSMKNYLPRQARTSGLQRPISGAYTLRLVTTAKQCLFLNAPYHYSRNAMFRMMAYPLVGL